MRGGEPFRYRMRIRCHISPANRHLSNARREQGRATRRWAQFGYRGEYPSITPPGSTFALTRRRKLTLVFVSEQLPNQRCFDFPPHESWLTRIKYNNDPGATIRRTFPVAAPTAPTWGGGSTPALVMLDRPNAAQPAAPTPKAAGTEQPNLQARMSYVGWSTLDGQSSRVFCSQRKVLTGMCFAGKHRSSQTLA